MVKILVIHGPNLNLLGEREVDIYGKTDLKSINAAILKKAKSLKADVEFFQSIHEGEIVEVIGKARGKFDVIVINPAAYTHTSVAIRDAISAVQVPTIEVHLSNIYAREEFRQKSLISPVAKGIISGFGTDSYLLGIEAAAAIGKKD
ncbi:MAG: type II 3-dehydroquinate dehydratase [Candidatus Omnitrophica bacterium]|nr:type II 3-dehydroquinate dehydratase [Candidatus Omnitrophota bacterium]